MAKKIMQTPGAPAATRTKRSPLGPTDGAKKPSGLPLEDWSRPEMVGELRRRGGAADNDSALGMKGTRGRSATNASAQFRISVSHKAPQPQQYPGTLAGGRIVPAVMGSKQRQNFDAQTGVLY